MVIVSFGDQATEDLFRGTPSRHLRRLPADERGLIHDPFQAHSDAAG